MMFFDILDFFDIFDFSLWGEEPGSGGPRNPGGPVPLGTRGAHRPGQLTGSIGTQTLDIVDACPDNFVVDALSAGNNAKLMADQVMKYRPKVASLSTPEAAAELKAILDDEGSNYAS